MGKNGYATTRLRVQIPLNADENWPLFIAECEKALQLQHAVGNKASRQNEWQGYYKAIISGESVTVDVLTSDFNEGIKLSVIEVDGRNRRVFRPLADFNEEDPIGTLTVVYNCHDLVNRFRKNGDEIPYKDKNQYLKNFATLLKDLGYKDLTVFGFTAETSSCQVDEIQTPTAEESEPTGAKTEKTFGEIVDDVLNSVIVPNEVSQADRKGGAISLPEWLGQLSLDERDQYAGQLHRLVNGLTDYMQLVTKMVDQLSRQKEPTEEERLQGVMDLFKCTAEEAKDILAKYQQEDDPDKDTEADDDEPILPQPKPVDPENQKTQPAEKYLKVLMDRDDIDDADIPNKIQEWAADGIAVPRTKVNEVLKAANVRYSKGGMKGQLVQFPKPRKQPKGKK